MTRWNGVHGLLCILSVVGLNGCWSTDSSKNQQILPTLNDIRRQLPPARNEDEAPKAPPTALIRQFDFRADASLASAWSLVDESSLPAEIVDLWHANGLRVGVLEEQNGQAFFAALPPPYKVQMRILAGSEQPSALAVAPRLRDVFRLKLTLSSEHHQPMVFRTGRCQFLVRYTKPASGESVLDLIPHHHVVRPSIRPRLPGERALDGRVFDELALRMWLPASQRLVVGIYQQPPCDSDSDTNEAAATPSGNAQAIDQTHPVLLPNKLGTLLLGASRTGTPVHSMLIFEGRPRPIADSEDSEDRR